MKSGQSDFLKNFINKLYWSMQVVILAWGLGTRLSEETSLRPKPMVEIGGKPILWHIMKIYASYGYKDFVICLWYKGYLIKEWFSNYFLHNSDVAIDIGKNEITVLNKNGEDWKVTLIDTGADTMTWGRLKRVAPYIHDNTFMMTYGDGVSNVDISKLVQFHQSHGKLATITSVQPEWKFGRLALDGDKVIEFAEKKDNQSAWINGGFMVLDKKVIDFISWDEMPFEKDPLENIAINGELMTYKHSGFWYAMDTLQNKNTLESLWIKGGAPWKIWQ